MNVNYEFSPKHISTEDKEMLPHYKHENDSGFDIRADIKSPMIIRPHEIKKITTGLKVELPVGYELQIRPRSGMSSKGKVAILGTVDTGYRGEIKIIVNNTSNDAISIDPYERVAQAVINEIPKINLIKKDSISSDTSRGEDGFNSTGAK